MEEKSLEMEMKQKELLKKIKKIEDEVKLEKGTDNVKVKYFEDCELNVGGNIIKVSVAEIKAENGNKDSKDRNKTKDKEYSKTYNIYMNIKGEDIKIAEIDEEGKLILDENAIEQIDPKNALGLKELGENEKPDISKLNEIEGKTSEDLEKELENEGKTNEFKKLNEEKIKDNNLEKVMERKAKEEGKTKDEIKANMIEIDLDRKVTNDKTFRDIGQIDKGIERAFLIPGKNDNDYTVAGITEDGEMKNLTNFKQIEGENPTRKVAKLGKDGENVESKTPIAMFEIEGSGMKEGITISKGKFEYKEVSYYRRMYENMYMTTTLAQKNGTDRDYADPEVKDLMDKNRTLTLELSEKVKFYETLENVKEKQELPDDIDITEDGIQVEELDYNAAKEKMINSIKENYGYKRDDATVIAEKILDEKMNFDEAREEVDKKNVKENNEENQKTPWDNVMGRRGY